MSPIAVHDLTEISSNNVANIKHSVARPPLRDHGVPVKPDYMYKFKYQHELPTHSVDFLEIPQDASPQSIATEFVSKLSHVLTSGDAAGFTALFLEQGEFETVY